jgi:NAD(P)H-flavin reductase
MKTLSGTITRIWGTFGQLAADITCAGNMIIVPGQYLSITTPDQITAIPNICFPIHINDEILQVSPIPNEWHPSQKVEVRGPFGHGFSIPQISKKVCLVSWDQHPNRLMDMLKKTIREQREIILVWDAFQQTEDSLSIPEDVEIMGLQNLDDAIRWADFIGMDSPINLLSEVARHKSILQSGVLTCPIQILVSTSMPCLGIADCGICSIPVKKGYKLTCKDGPVFDFGELDL